MSVRMIASATGGPHPIAALTPMSLIDLTAGSASAEIVFVTDGSITKTGGVSDVLANWYFPSVTSIGSRYWIKFTKTAGSAWNAGLTDATVYALTSNRTLLWTAAGGAKTASVTVEIFSDSGATVLVGTGTLTVEVDGT
jgi:hypothetical protein